MSNYILNFQVDGGDISATEKHITADSQEFVTAVFSFDESWADLLKTAVFRVGEIVYHTILENDCCTIPHEALQDGIIYISVFGVLGNTRATTCELPLSVQKSGYISCEPTAPSPDPYNYFLEKVTELKESAATNAERSEQAANDAEISNNSAAKSAASAAQDAEQTSIYREEAVKSSLAASASSQSAFSSAEVATTNANIAYESAQKAQEYANKSHVSVMEEIESHNAGSNTLAHPNLAELASEARSIALGKANSLVFDSLEQLQSWVAGEFSRYDGKTTHDLKVGDNLYIIEVGVPDYWWDGSNIQPLGAEKPDFSDYYTKEQIDEKLGDSTFSVLSRSEYDAAYTSGSLDAGRIYLVYEEEVK